MARAVDEAGNVGPGTEPVTLTLDNRGPVLTARQVGSSLMGTARDGSGVASVEVSLDGGAHYQPAALAGENWSFDMTAWSGGAVQNPAIVRARDVWGNVTRQITLLETHDLYVPLLLRH